LFTERYKLSGVSSISPVVIWFFAAMLIFVNTAYPQVVPYINDIVGEDGMEKSESGMGSSEERLRLIGRFKLFNPDTVPFYMWAIFEHGGRFKHTKYNDVPSVRLVDLELRYKNNRGQPMVKKFPNGSSEPRMLNKRFGGSWLGGGRSERKRSRGRGAVGAEEELDGVGVGFDAGGASRSGGRGRGSGGGVSEIVFWKEDAQAYYEMELWGVLYAPDVREAVVAGSYVENISFEIEPAR